MLLTRARVRRVTRPTRSFVRVDLAHPDLADFGVDGPLWDQRIKLILPGTDGRLPQLSPETWWDDFLALPPEAGVAMRTYTIADVHGSGADTQVVVDAVVHPGATGPGSRWADAVTDGDEVLLLVPRRDKDEGGIEFDPGDADRLLLVGDETALPAIVQILRELPGGVTGSVFVEVPHPDDVRSLKLPPGVELTWLVRGTRPVGQALVDAVCAHLGSTRSDWVPADEVDPEVWETPTWSSSEDAVPDASPPGPTHPGTDGRYAWIAGESRMVTTLRRHLVTDLGLPRRQVAFMGYWREGVAMRG